MKCNSCKYENSPDAKFCQECGAKLELSCPSCHELIAPGAKFCANCGFNLAKESPTLPTPVIPIESESIATEAERRQLTVLFCDMKDSTAISEKLDAEDFRNLILSYHNIAEKVIKRYQGHVAQYLGDGLLVYFGYPQGLEDAPMAAARAALGIQQSMSHANKVWLKENKPNVAIRIGIHTGLVVVDDHLALGDTTNIAARIEGLASDNCTVVSGNTAKLISGWFQLKSLGNKTIKGLSQAMELFEVIKENSVKNRIDLLKGKSLSPLVGREEETRLIKRAWDRSKEGSGQAILINGEAGIGKSRLIDFMRDHVYENNEIWLAEIQCSLYHQNTPLYPIIEFINTVSLQITIEDDIDLRFAKLEALVLQLGLEMNETIVLLADLLSIELPSEYQRVELAPGLQKKKTYELILHTLFQRASNQALLIIIEDLHWADHSTLEWLDLFIDQLSSYPIFVLATTRPGYQASWVGRSYTNQLSLSKILPDKIEAMCSHLTRGKKLPPELIQIIITKTDGVPLFIEELTKMLLDSELLVEKDEHFILKGRFSDISIPSTLQDSLTARLDRLGSLKEIIQKGSVIGREFSLDLLHKLTGGSKEILYSNLSQLVSSEFLYHKGVGDHSVYLIKHAMLRDTAYESLLHSRKQILHGKIADIIKTEDSISSQPEVLAYHLQEAGRIEESINQWFAAGLFSLKKYASSEALKHFERALELLNGVASSVGNIQMRINCLMQLISSRIIRSGFVHPDVEKYSLECLSLSEHHPSIQHTSGVLHFLSWHHNFGASYAPSLKYNLENLELVKNSGASYLISDVKINLGCTQYLLGNMSEARTHLVEAFDSIIDDEPSIFATYGFGDPKIVAINHCVTLLTTMGEMKEVRKYLEIGYAKIENTDNPWSKCLLYIVDTVYQLYFSKNMDAAIISTNIVMKLAHEHGNEFWIGFGTILNQIAEARNGNEAALGVAYHIFNAFKEANALSYRISMGSYLLSASLAHKKYDMSQGIIDDLMEHAKFSGEGFFLPEVHRYQAALYRVKQDLKSSELSLHKAIQLAVRQKSKWFELLASKDLAIQWFEEGKIKEARLHLSQITNQFDPQIALPDLEESIDLLKRMQV